MKRMRSFTQSGSRCIDHAICKTDGGGARAGHPSDVHLHFIQPGKPVQHAFIESFNGKFRDECLNEHWFVTLQEAQLVIEAWRREYNEERTHSAVGDVTPQGFILNHQNGSI